MLSITEIYFIIRMEKQIYCMHKQVNNNTFAVKK